MTTEPVARERPNAGASAEAAAATTNGADAASTPSIVGVSPEFPVAFEDPALAELTWEWDDMHMPHALAPLAGDYSVILADAFREPFRRYPEFGPFPQRWFAASFHGYIYFAYQRNVAEAERKALFDRMVALQRARIPVTQAYWHDELIPELEEIYASMEAAPVATAPLASVAEAWDAGWAGLRRAWDIHFDIICGPYQILDDLVDVYDAATPGAASGEALRLIQGLRHELYEVEVGTERLASMLRDSLILADALRSGVRSMTALRDLPGGSAFVAALEAFLAEHGHLGQSVDDLTLPSWGEEPANLLAELAKRLDHQPEAADARRACLEAEAISLVDAARARLADRPADLAKFEDVLRYAREIGFITETHNYWIDRKAQARLRALALRIGARMAADGIVDRADDVFYLHADEISPALRGREDQRLRVAERRVEHERQKTLKPPKIVGRDPTPPPAGITPDRFGGEEHAATDDGVLHGTGSSAGIARGPARVVLTSDEFDRIKPGDIIVCPSSNPSWVPIFTIAGGLVTNTGGILSHAAVVAREFGLPAVTGVKDATTTIEDGRQLEIDGTAGTVRQL